MSFVPDFSATQSPGSPKNITFTDTSTGSEGAIDSRRIYIQQPNGTFLVEEGVSVDYNEWPLPLSTPIELEDILSIDIGARVVIEYLDSGGTILYDKTKYYGFNCFNKDFDYKLTQNVASNPLLMNDNRFWANKDLLQTYIKSGDNAIERASDINACQQCYDLATELRLEAKYVFNQNS